jgi:hypothetical protein
MLLIVPRLYRTGDSAVVEVTDRPTSSQQSPQFVAAFGRPVSELEPSEQSGLSPAATSDGKTTDLS